MTERSYLVVPFQRSGASVGARRAFMFPAAGPAKLAARQLAMRAAGVAVLERVTDYDTGEDQDKLIAGFGAVPPRFPSGYDWTMRLN